MTYKHGTFLIYQPSEILRLKSFDDVFKLLDTGDLTDGIPQLEKLSELNFILTRSKEGIFSAVAHIISDTSSLYFVSSEFGDAVAAANDEELTRVTTTWADSESWRDIDINPFDLFGLIVGLNSLCRKARDEGKQLYLLLSGDAE